MQLRQVSIFQATNLFHAWTNFPSFQLGKSTQNEQLQLRFSRNFFLEWHSDMWQGTWCRRRRSIEVVFTHSGEKTDNLILSRDCVHFHIVNFFLCQMSDYRQLEATPLVSSPVSSSSNTSARRTRRVNICIMFLTVLWVFLSLWNMRNLIDCVQVYCGCVGLSIYPAICSTCYR